MPYPIYACIDIQIPLTPMKSILDTFSVDSAARIPLLQTSTRVLDVIANVVFSQHSQTFHNLNKSVTKLIVDRKGCIELRMNGLLKLIKI